MLAHGLSILHGTFLWAVVLHIVACAVELPVLRPYLLPSQPFSGQLPHLIVCSADHAHAPHSHGLALEAGLVSLLDTAHTSTDASNMRRLVMLKCAVVQAPLLYDTCTLQDGSLHHRCAHIKAALSISTG